MAELENFLDMDFDIDYSRKAIYCNNRRDNSIPNRTYRIRDILSAHEADIRTADNSKADEYAGSTTLRYSIPEGNAFARYSCPWIPQLMKDQTTEFQTMQEFIEDNGSTVWNGEHTEESIPDRLYYVKEENAYFAYMARGRYGYWDKDAKTTKYTYETAIRPVNLLGPRQPVNASDAGKETELSIVPVRIDETAVKTLTAYADHYGDLMFLSFGSYDSAQGDAEDEDPGPYGMAKTKVQSMISKGDSQDGDRPQFYDRLYVGWWDGTYYKDRAIKTQLPRPAVEQYQFYKDAAGQNRVAVLPFSFRLDTRTGKQYDRLPIDTSTKTTVRFLSDELPDVTQTFLINNRPYLCARLTATFTAKGRSRLLKGEFYRIKDRQTNTGQQDPEE